MIVTAALRANNSYRRDSRPAPTLTECLLLGRLLPIAWTVAPVIFSTQVSTQYCDSTPDGPCSKPSGCLPTFCIGDAAIAAITSPSTPRAEARQAGRHRVAEAPVRGIGISPNADDDGDTRRRNSRRPARRCSRSATRPHRQSATESFSSRSPAGFDMEPSIASAPNTGCKDSFPRRPLRNGALFRSE